MSLTQGTRLGPYEILAPIGAGGMGEVYRAHDARLRRDVAVKILPVKFSSDPERLRRLQQEAQTAGALNHPNILTIYDIGTQGGIAYVVSELLEGKTLRSQLEAGPIAHRQALGQALQIAHGLDAAHARGIVHRDLKPENIFITRDGRVKILDFGLAKLAEPAMPPLAHTDLPTLHQGTEPGVVLGTLGYMSPEQLRGQPADGRSDIFSFGVILFEMLTGTHAFRRDTAADTISAILTREAPNVSGAGSEAPPALDRIVRHCLEKDPARRFQSAHDLAFDLETISGDHAAGAPAGADARGRPPRSLRRAAPWVAGVAGLVAAAALALCLGALRGGAIDSIAVLPFVNAGGDPDMEYLSDGITESLIISLSRFPNLTVKSRNSVFHYKGRDVDAQQAGRALDVAAVLTGRVLQRADSLSISAELIDVRDSSHLWGGQYGGKTSEILSMQEEIARQISDNLRMRLTGEEKTRLAKPPTENPAAFQLYMKGRYYWNQRGKGLLRAAEYFEQARAADPRYALAYVGLADSYTLLAFYGFQPAREAYPKATAAVTRALELDPSLGEAHASLGYIHHFYDWDLEAAEREYRRALELAPNHPPAHYWLAAALGVRGEWEQAFALIEKSLVLDPMSPFTNAQSGWTRLRHGDYEESIKMSRKTIEYSPTLVIGHMLLGHALIMVSRLDEAIAELQEAVRLSEGDAWMKGSLAYAYAASGRKDLAAGLLKELQENAPASGYRRSYPIALAYVGLGDKDRAFEFLDKAYDERDSLLGVLGSDHLFDPLHSDPRWPALLRKIGVVPEAMLSARRSS